MNLEEKSQLHFRVFDLYIEHVHFSMFSIANINDVAQSSCGRMVSFFLAFSFVENFKRIGLI